MRWVSESVSGDVASLAPLPGDISDAKTAIIKWYGQQKTGDQPAGSIKAISYQGLSPVSGRMKFLVNSSTGLTGLEMAKTPIGWRAMPMPKDEVGLFGFIKKTVEWPREGCQENRRQLLGISGSKVSETVALVRSSSSRNRRSAESSRSFADA